MHLSVVFVATFGSAGHLHSSLCARIERFSNRLHVSLFFANIESFHFSRSFETFCSHQPWEAPLDVQQTAGCIVGVNYPRPMVDFKTASARNRDTMKYIRKSLLANGEAKQHCRPSNDQEIRQFFWLF
jgi:FAD binding domain of DNA photolyase